MLRTASVTTLMVGMALTMIGSAAQARNYDCTKPGNANKAACRTPATAGAPPATATPAVTAPTPAKRNYDCSKPGNASKAVCKSAIAAPAATPQAAPAGAARPAAVSIARSLPAPVVAARAAAPVSAAAAGSPAGPAVISASGARIVPWTTKTGKLVHYDCSKAGNFTKKACKQ